MLTFLRRYGRKIPLFGSYFVFAIFQIPVAVAQNIETVLICRFLAGERFYSTSVEFEN